MGVDGLNTYQPLHTALLTHANLSSSSQTLLTLDAKQELADQRKKRRQLKRVVVVCPSVPNH